VIAGQRERAIPLHPEHLVAPSSVTHDYSVFGGNLRSEIPFPELVAAVCDRPDWTFRIARGAPAAVRLERIGERQLGPETYRLFRTSSGLRLEYSHAGLFDISNDGTSIVWYHRPDAHPELVRSIVLGSALALALELKGMLCLHGSAVALGRGSRAIAFLGPKYHGKSTLATALTAAGARLIGDDLLAITPGPPTTVRPGVASVRLWSDTARALSVDTLCARVIHGVKTTATAFSERALVRGVAPLSAVYVLDPVGTGGEQAAGRRERLGGVAAAIALAHQTKLPGTLVGLHAAGSQLAAAAAVAATVPVWTLRAVRDFSVLPALVEQILEWHQEDTL
jgi:hypothetical protein